MDPLLTIIGCFFTFLYDRDIDMTQPLSLSTL